MVSCLDLRRCGALGVLCPLPVVQVFVFAAVASQVCREAWGGTEGVTMPGHGEVVGEADGCRDIPGADVVWCACKKADGSC